ncbi:MAG: hypothetical protein M3016_08155 [Actinomycetota bacterium]|nr:hypothetical protein [Actinomycetota bacterium]
MPPTWSGPHSSAYIVVQWYDCDRSGNHCSPIPGAFTPNPSTPPTYTVHTTDAGSRIEVSWQDNTGPAQFSGPTLVVGLPVNNSPPTISGIPQQGRTLTANPGSWTASPNSYSYQWLRCDHTGSGCQTILGAKSPSYKLVKRDVGSTIEVQVTATNSVGSGTANSAATAVVGPPSPYDIGQPNSIGTIRATMSWEFLYGPNYTRVLALAVHRASVGTTIKVGCRGRGCPFTRRSTVVAKRGRCAHVTGRRCGTKPRTVNLWSWFRYRHLHPPATFTVGLTRRGVVGKQYVFRTRPGHGPRIRILCLPPGARHARVRC